MKFVRASVVLVVLSVFSNMLFAEELRLGGYDKPPYMMQEGEKSGICVDIIHEAAKRAGFDTSYELFPHARGLKNFSENKVDAETCVSPKWRSKYKEISLYSDEFFTTENVVFVGKNSSVATTKDIQDFRGRTFGTVIGYFITDGFQEKFEAGEIIREDTNTQVQNIRKLAAGRIDGIVIDRITGLYLMEELGFDPADFKIAYVFETKSHLSVRIHKNRADVIPNLNKALSEMKREGAFHEIIDKYMSLPN